MRLVLRRWWQRSGMPPLVLMPLLYKRYLLALIAGAFFSVFHLSYESYRRKQVKFPSHRIAGQVAPSSAALHLVINAFFTNRPALLCPSAQIHRTVGFRFGWVRRSLM